MFKDLVYKNRSYRGFDESYRFTKEELLDLVDLTRFTPSSVNAQPLKYHIAFEKDEVDLIQSLTKWARALPQEELPHKGMCPTGFIIVCQDLTVSDNTARFQKDVGIVAQTILLSAVENGLGGCMIGNFSAQEVKEKLGFGETVMPMLIIALGKPNEKIVITEIENGDSIKYYRDENDTHYVPKRKLKDIVI